MTLTMTIAGAAVTPLYEGFQITRDLGGRNSTCQFAVDADPRSAKVGTAVVGTAAVDGEVPPVQAEVIVLDGSSVRQFAGFLVKVTPDKWKDDKALYQCEAVDYTVLLERTTITSAAYTDDPDSTIIADLFATYLPSVDASTYVSTVETIPSITLDGLTVRAAMDRLCELSGAEWYLDFDQKLHYFTPTATPASFGLSESPDNVTTFDILWTGEHKPSFSSEFTAPCNRVRVIGAVSDGANLEATANDERSQRVFSSIWSRTIVDRDITTTEEAAQRAAIEVARYAWPEQNGSLSFRHDGADIGQYITVTAPSLGIGGSFIIRRLTITQTSPTHTWYTADIGSYRPDLVRMLATVARQTRQSALVPNYAPADGSITAAHFAATIEPVGLVNQAPNASEQLAIAKTQSIVYNAYDKKTYRWNDTLGVYVRRIGAGDLEADSVTAGTIAAGAIRAVDAVFDSGAIQSADIASLNAGKITAGTLNCSLITVSNLSASSITGGTLSASYISGGILECSTITVQNLSASSINTGTLSASRISGGTLDCSTLTVSNLSASSITTGSMSIDRLSGWNGGSVNVSSGGMTFTGTGGITIGGSGSISVLAGVVTAQQVNAISGGSGWQMSGGAYPSLSAGSGSYVDCATYKAGGTSGISGTRTVKDGSGNNKSVTISGGIITSWET